MHDVVEADDTEHDDTDDDTLDAGELDPTRRDREYVFIKRACSRCGIEFTRRINASAASRIRLCKRCRHSSDAALVEYNVHVGR